jgi:RNA polymerase sigma factor (sigma-70 family)
MTDVPDDRLLEQFARNGSEEAFAALVQRHIPLVHSVALRHTVNPQHAEDITQAVFVILARKAGALGRKTVLPGWLYHTARLTAANLQRAEARRVRREQEAFMQSQLEEPATDNLWRELSPQLDEAMAGLGTAERDALVLRYFQNKSMAEVAKFLGLEENTAQKRVSRALEKLQKFFTKRGMDSTAAAIAENISAHSVQAVPVALAKSVTAVALAKGATVSTSTLTLIKGALKIMAWTKVKTASATGMVLLLCAGVLTVAIRDRSRPPTAKAAMPVSSTNASFDRSTPKGTLRYLAAMLDSGDARRVAESVQLDSGSNSQAGNAVANIVSGQTAFKGALIAKFGAGNVAEALQKWRLITVPIEGLDEAQERIVGDSATVQLPEKRPLHFVRVLGNWRLVLITGNESKTIAQFNRVGKLMLDISSEVAADKYNSPQEVFRVLQTRIMSAQ